MNAVLHAAPVDHLLSADDTVADVQAHTSGGSISGSDNVDEMLSWTGNRAVHFVDGVACGRFTVASQILDAAWCQFSGSATRVLCLLQCGGLSVIHPGGAVLTAPLQRHFQHITPLPQAVILSGKGICPHILQHPLEEAEEVALHFTTAAQLGPSSRGWHGERVIWSGTESPLVVTHNDKNHVSSVWRLSEHGAHCPVSFGPLVAPSTPVGASSRLSHQLNALPVATPSPASVINPNGSISSLAFSPVPHLAVPIVQETGSPATVLPPPEDALQAFILYRSQHAPGQCPQGAFLADDEDEGLLMCLTDEASRMLTVLSVTSDCSRAELAFQVPGVLSAAAVCVSRLSPTCNGRQLRDLLLLMHDGQAALHVGQRPLCHVDLLSHRQLVPDPLASHASPTVQGSGFASSSCNIRHPDAAASEQLPPPARVQHAIGHRVTVCLTDGSSRRIALPVLPAGHVTHVAVTALREALTPEQFAWVYAALIAYSGGCLSAATSFQALSSALCSFIPPAPHQPSSTTVDSEIEAASTEEEAATTPLRRGRSAGAPSPTAATDPAITNRSTQKRLSAAAAAAQGFSASARRRSPTKSRTRSSTGGSASGAQPLSSWELLLQSPHHRAVVESQRFPWLPSLARPSPEQAPAPDNSGNTSTPQQLLPQAALKQALEALHSVYEDCKLNMLCTADTKTILGLLLRLARGLHCPGYACCYKRDLACSGTGGVNAELAEVEEPPSLAKALRAALRRQPIAEQELPSLVRKESGVVQRSVDLLCFFRLTGQACMESMSATQTAASEAEPTTPQQQVSHPGGALQQLAGAMVARGWTQARISTLPFGVALPLQLALLRCASLCQPDWPVEVRTLVGRSDLSPKQRTPGATAAEALVEGFAAGDGTPLSGGRSTPPAAEASEREQAQWRKARQEGTADVAPASRGHVAPYLRPLVLPGSDPSTDRQTAGETQASQATLDDRFPDDLRLLEVQRLLSSSEPTPIAIDGEGDVGDTDVVARQQQRLMALAVRTLSRPLGRGAFNLGTQRLLPTEALAPEPLSLAGRLTLHNDAVTQLDTSALSTAGGGGAMCDSTSWPEFHNGVAAGLCMSAESNDVSRTWIVYNRPKAASWGHAGVLMALGLTGHLRSLSGLDVYGYLHKEHDATHIAVLLGLGAAHAGSCDDEVSKSLLLHMPGRHPQSFPEVEVSLSVQAAAVVGVGLLYRGSCTRQVAGIMAEEIGRRAATEIGGTAGVGTAAAVMVTPALAAAATHREGYALAAGYALGLVVLGKGRSAPGLSDLHLDTHLMNLMQHNSRKSTSQTRSATMLQGSGAINRVFGPEVLIGCDLTIATTPRDTVYRHDSRSSNTFAHAAAGVTCDTSSGEDVPLLVLEGGVRDVAVTGAAATVALALMFLRTGDATVAAAFALPTTPLTLDAVRPDHVTLRVMGRALVMWDTVRPTYAWLREQLPPLLQFPLSKIVQPLDGEEQRGGPDRNSVAQAHVKALAGGCVALGLRYAGTWDPQAAATVKEQLLYFLACKKIVPDSRSQDAQASQVDRPTLESAAGAAAMALGAIMAGSGDLATLQLLRGLARRLSPTSATAAVVVGAAPGLQYGHHMAISVALGFLCLGRGARTFSRSREAVAALVGAMYPALPTSSVDNRCHLQALRHLYVLAAVPLKRKRHTPGRPARHDSAEGAAFDKKPSTDSTGAPGRAPFPLMVQQHLDADATARDDVGEQLQQSWHSRAASEWWREAVEACSAAGNQGILTPLLALHEMLAAVNCAIDAGEDVDGRHVMPGGMHVTAAMQQLAVLQEGCHQLAMLHGPPGNGGATAPERQVLRLVTLAVEGVLQRFAYLWVRLGFQAPATGMVSTAGSNGSLKDNSGPLATFHAAFMQARDLGLAIVED